MALKIMTMSPMQRQTVQELRALGQKLFLANQDSQSSHLLSAAMAYIRSLAASALDSDPNDISWKQIAHVLRGAHNDMIMLGQCHLDRASYCMGRPYIDKHDLAFGGLLESVVSPWLHCIVNLPILASVILIFQEVMRSS